MSIFEEIEQVLLDHLTETCRYASVVTVTPEALQELQSGLKAKMIVRKEDYQRIVLLPDGSVYRKTDEEMAEEAKWRETCHKFFRIYSSNGSGGGVDIRPVLGQSVRVKVLERDDQGVVY
jgi:hypothetical protein